MCTKLTVWRHAAHMMVRVRARLANVIYIAHDVVLFVQQRFAAHRCMHAGRYSEALFRLPACNFMDTRSNQTATIAAAFVCTALALRLSPPRTEPAVAVAIDGSVLVATHAGAACMLAATAKPFFACRPITPWTHAQIKWQQLRRPPFEPHSLFACRRRAQSQQWLWPLTAVPF